MSKRFILNETSYHGYGAVDEIVPEVRSRGYRKALVVTDAGLVACGVAGKVTALLDNAHCPYEVFSDVKANPTVKTVKDGTAAFKKAMADYIIAVGGGSVMDTAKAVGIIANNPEYADVLSLEGVAQTKNRSVPLIAVATTAGTASEVTINYVITDEDKHRKFVCVDPHDIPIIAIVDPAMMANMPKGLTAATGMDALTHAIEGYITKGAWEMSDALNLKAIEIIARSLRKAVAGDAKGREDMALGQYITGMAFSNVGLGAVHGMAHPLGAFYDIAHGVANAVLLPYVMAYNADCTSTKYKDIAEAMGIDTLGMDAEEYRAAALNAVKKLASDVGIPKTLKEIGVKEEDLEALAEAAMADVCTGGNPKECTKEVLLAIYKKAFAG